MSVYFDWHLVYTCNYRCSYCYFTASGWETHYPQNAFPGLERLEAVWTRIRDRYGRCEIKLAGGECSTYPRFFDFIRMLSRLHAVTLATNLAFDVEKLVAAADPASMSVSATFHPEFADLEPFLKKCAYLKARGVSVGVNYVPHPDQIEAMAALKRRVNAEGIGFYINPFSGVHEGQVYPGAYTRDERRRIREVFSDAGHESSVSLARLEREASGFTAGVASLAGLERPAAGASPGMTAIAQALWSEGRSVLCRMGQKFALIRPNGDAFRCFAVSPRFQENYRLGNIFEDDDFRLLDRPAACCYHPCPEERAMLVGKDEELEGVAP